MSVLYRGSAVLKGKTNRQSTYNVTLRYVRATVVALGIQHAMHMRHIVICVLPRSTIFFHIYPRKAQFSKNEDTKHEMCFDFLYIFVQHFSF